MKVIPVLLMTILLLFTSKSFNSFAHNNDINEAKAVSENSGIENEAGKTIAQFHHAIKSGNRKKARSLLTDNVMIFEGGRVERTADEYAEHHMLADMKYLADINAEVLEQQVKVLGNVAYSMSRNKLTGQYKGKYINSEGMESMVLLKKEGKWKIAHIHWSH